MPKSDDPVQRARRLVGIPWLAEDGSLDPARFPIEGLLQQALNGEEASFRTACTLLQSICSHGRPEAGVYLLGLLRFYQDDLASESHKFAMPNGVPDAARPQIAGRLLPSAPQPSPLNSELKLLVRR